MAIRVRKSVATILADPADETIAWYRKGVAAMKTRPINDPRSWRFQAAIHDFATEAELVGSPTLPQLPPRADRDRFWRQCQHFSWYFLPWHRIYLHHFERMILDEIVTAGGPADWALPFWDYSANPQDVVLPKPFRDPKTAANALFVPQRSSAANAGLAFADAGAVDLSDCLDETVFADDPLLAPTSFGGPVTLFNHDDNQNGAGVLEIVPHGSMHVSVGGWMQGFDTAPLDPIFWLHHCNIDRVWELWRSAGNVNPTDPAWLTDVGFDFRDLTGNAVTMTPSQVLDTTALPLEYRYEGITPPPAPPVTVAPAQPGVHDAGDASMPELLGATRTGFDLSRAPTRAVLHTPKVARGPAADAPALLSDAESRVFLRIEGLTAEDHACSYDLYVGIPEGSTPKDHPELRVGRLPMFGLKESSRRGGTHSGVGLTYNLDATKVLRRLGIGAHANPETLPLTFVPIGEDLGSVVHVGRVSLYSA